MTLLEPDRGQIERFVACIFRHAGTEGWVSIRAFFDNGNESVSHPGVPLESGLDYLIDGAEDIARRAANEPKQIVFTPPLGVFNNKKTAREEDLIAGLVLSVDCDQHPRRALATLSAIIGPPTVIVRSGGQWTDPETGEVQDKLHLHWRLAHPAQGDDLPKLKQARALAARIVGGDESNVPVCHPIRWPGSWHRKGEPVLCEIEDADPDREIDLSIALDLLKAAAPAPQPARQRTDATSHGNVRDATNSLSSFNSGDSRLTCQFNALAHLDRSGARPVWHSLLTSTQHRCLSHLRQRSLVAACKRCCRQSHRGIERLRCVAT